MDWLMIPDPAKDSRRVSQGTTMRQLSGADSMFLQFERGNNFMHVASLAIYDPSTAPGGGTKRGFDGCRVHLRMRP